MAFVVFLRGVNVGGRRAFRPTLLARELSNADVVNIGAAGTFVIRTSMTQAQLRAQLARRLPFDAEIMICNGRDILRLMSGDPFAGQPVRSDIVRFVSILSRAPRSVPSLPVSLPAGGRWLVKILARDRRFVLGVYRRHMRTIGCLGEIDRLFGTRVTTRNWKTIAAIAKVLGDGVGSTDVRTVAGDARAKRVASGQSDAAARPRAADRHGALNSRPARRHWNRP